MLPLLASARDQAPPSKRNQEHEKLLIEENKMPMIEEKKIEFPPVESLVGPFNQIIEEKSKGNREIIEAMRYDEPEQINTVPKI